MSSWTSSFGSFGTYTEPCSFLRKNFLKSFYLPLGNLGTPRRRRRQAFGYVEIIYPSSRQTYWTSPDENSDFGWRWVVEMKSGWLKVCSSKGTSPSRGTHLCTDQGSSPWLSPSLQTVSLFPPACLKWPPAEDLLCSVHQRIWVSKVKLLHQLATYRYYAHDDIRRVNWRVSLPLNFDGNNLIVLVFASTVLVVLASNLSLKTSISLPDLIFGYFARNSFNFWKIYIHNWKIGKVHVPT